MLQLKEAGVDPTIQKSTNQALSKENTNEKDVDEEDKDETEDEDENEEGTEEEESEEEDADKTDLTGGIIIELFKSYLNLLITKIDILAKNPEA